MNKPKLLKIVTVFICLLLVLTGNLLNAYLFDNLLAIVFVGSCIGLITTIIGMEVFWRIDKKNRYYK